MIVLPLVLGAAFPLPNAQPETPAALMPLSSLTTAVLLQEAEEEKPDGLWHGNLNIGISKSEGNADIQTFSLDARGVREFEQHRYTVEGLWYYAFDANRSDADGQLIQRRALGSFKYDQFIAEKTYFLVSAFAETQFAALLDLRWSLSAGIGHQWRDDDQWKINTEIGLAYFDEEFDNGEQADYLAIRAAWDLWTQVTETVVFGHFAELFPSLEDKDDIYGRATTYFEAQLSERMTGRVSWVASYDNTPTLDADGARLERLDSLYLFTLGWTF